MLRKEYSMSGYKESAKARIKKNIRTPQQRISVLLQEDFGIDGAVDFLAVLPVPFYRVFLFCERAVCEDERITG